MVFTDVSKHPFQLYPEGVGVLGPTTSYRGKTLVSVVSNVRRNRVIGDVEV